MPWLTMLRTPTSPPAEGTLRIPWLSTESTRSSFLRGTGRATRRHAWSSLTPGLLVLTQQELGDALWIHETFADA